MYGKKTEYAIAAMSRLAEVYDGGTTRLSAAEIAESRGLQRPFVAKILSALSQAGLVTGSRGPGGGFALAKDPKTITLYNVSRLFEREDNSNLCPFGGGVCGVGDPCPLHARFVSVQKAMDRLLHKTTFDEFRLAHGRRRRHAGTPSGRRTKRKRASYRALRTNARKRRSVR